jgi:hypothetical protein
VSANRGTTTPTVVASVAQRAAWQTLWELLLADGAERDEGVEEENGEQEQARSGAHSGGAALDQG